MVKNGIVTIQIPITQEEHSELVEVKKREGKTWREIIELGVGTLE